MKNEYTIGTTETTETKWDCKFPEYSEWKCHLFGGGGAYGFIWTPRKGEHPNWFWRKMQYLCFGFKWEKKEK